MPVESFIPTSESKMTIEKTVKPKLSLKELTTIELPGRPLSADIIEENLADKKKTRQRRPKKESGEAKDITKKEYILIITEKPQAALKIANALGNARKYSEDKVPYYEVSYNNEKIIVASAVGHLYNLTYKPGQKGYPIFELEWRPSYERSSASAFTKKYLLLLKRLSKKAKSFMIATDYDIEGEVIGWNVLRFICGQNTAKRMKFSTLTKPELLKAFESPMPELDWGHAYAGETRHILDWLYGINLSRALMSAIKKTGSFKILSIGRVQGPALKIIVEREREILKFKSEPYWQVFALVGKQEFKHPKDIFDKKELKKFEKIKEAFAETELKEEKVPPPFPFDLTTLQREAYNLHRISPSEALRIAQKLYLEGLISYPRTSSQKIPDSIEPKKILKQLQKNFQEFTKKVSRSSPVEGKKSDPAHPSIYPTGEFADLEENEKKLYDLIVKRFISSFCPDAIMDNKRITLTAENDKNIKFTASGLKIKNPGWTEVYPAVFEDKHLDDLNGKVNIDKINFEEKETQPPKRYTPASLISLLEKKNLGTKATRSMIVDTLFDRGYLDGKSIKATQLGMKLIESLEKHSPIIIDEELTRQLEKQMDKLQNSNTSQIDLKHQEEEIIEKVKRVITDISKEFVTKEREIGLDLLKGIETQRKDEQQANTLMVCPVCKKGELRIIYSKKTRKQFVACSAYPECKTTYSLPPNALIKNTGKKSESGLPLLMAIRKGKRPWEFPFNPNWKEEQKDKESNEMKSQDEI